MTVRCMVALAVLALASGSSSGTAPAAPPTASAAPSGSDWPHWEGPNYDGSSPEKGLLREWPKDGPQVLWRAKIKQGWTCPSIFGNDVILSMTDFDARHWQAKEEIVVCLDAGSGQERWRYSYPSSYNNNQVGWATGGTRSTPTVTDKYVYAIDPLGNIRCLDRAGGKLVWEKALAPEFFFGPGSDHKGFACSPLVHDNVLVVFSGGKKCYSYCLGLDARSGKQLWLNQDDKLREKTSMGGWGQSPVLITLNKEPCALMSYNRYLRAFQLKDGKEVLKCDAVPDEGRSSNMTGPLVVGNRIVLLNDLAPMTCVDVDLNSLALPAKLAWTSSDYFGYSAYHMFVHYEGYLYGFDSAGHDPNNVGGHTVPLECIDLKTGKVVWKKDGFFQGYSRVLADGLLFVRSLQTLSLIEATPKGFVLKGKMEKLHSLATGGVMDARGMTDCVTPALSRGKLYVRTPEELICLKVSK